MFDCGNESCSNTFGELQKLIDHLEGCNSGQVNENILKQKLGCQWCNVKDLDLYELANHFKDEHLQVFKFFLL